MKLDELIQRVGVDNVGVQVLQESLTSAKQRRGFVEVSFGTDCVSMHDIATHEWENVVFVISMKRQAFEGARDATASHIDESNKKVSDANTAARSGMENSIGPGAHAEKKE